MAVPGARTQTSQHLRERGNAFYKRAFAPGTHASQQYLYLHTALSRYTEARACAEAGAEEARAHKNLAATNFALFDRLEHLDNLDADMLALNAVG
jgi:hypothetical protein